MSDLESVRYWRMRDDAPLEDLVKQLRHEGPVTDAMESGVAFADMMERITPGAHDVEEAKGWKFRFELDDTIYVPSVRELKCEYDMNSVVGPVRLVGRCDGMQGTMVRDQKLTEKWDPEKYTDSLQWRAYLVMFGCRSFTYDVFECRRDGSVKEAQIIAYHKMTFYRYDGIDLDVQRAVDDTASIIYRHMPERVL